jgi:hypothetical protein
VLLRLSSLALTGMVTLLRLLPMSSTDKDTHSSSCSTSSTNHALGHRAFLSALLHRLPRPTLRSLCLIVSPDTILRWHRDLLRRHQARVPTPTAGTTAHHPQHPLARPATGSRQPELGLPPRPRRTRDSDNHRSPFPGLGDTHGQRHRTRAPPHPPEVVYPPASSGSSCPPHTRHSLCPHPGRHRPSHRCLPRRWPETLSWISTRSTPP